MKKKILKWVIVAAVIAAAAIYLGVGEFLQNLGKKSVEVGEELEKLKGKAEDVSREAGERIKKLRREDLKREADKL